MGSGASVEEGAEGSARPPDSGRPPSTVGSGRNTPSGSRPASRRASLSSTNTWRSAFKNPNINNSSLRKIRAAALGRKSAVTVIIDKTGFSLQHIQICEGQVVSWEWNEPESQGFNVTQVSHDGDQYRSVPGGFNSGPVTKQGRFSQQFNLIGEYKFVSAGIRCTPLIVEVFERKDVEAELNDQGFAPKIIRVDESSGVIWRWSGCSLPHTVTEARYSHKRGAMVQRENAEKAIPTKAGSFRSVFPKPGIFYFQTEGTTTGVLHTCIVHVRERQRESRVEVLDRTFNPAILVIEEGDRVWWSWTREKCKKTHCIYQIEPPPLMHPMEEAYKPFKNGFKWPQPSKAGMMSCEFYEPGVYYYSDHNFDEAAEYIGTLIVRPKTREHFIEVTEEGFSPDVLYANTGDRVWWTWSADDVTIPRFSLREVDKVLSPLANRPSIEDDSTGEGSYMDESLENMKVQVGLDVIMLGSIGVYTHCLADPDQRSIATCSVIASAGPRNHTVHVTDTGFEPKVVTVHPNDRIWWVWQETKKQHNIIQVSHQGNHIKGGFCSGASSDSPSAFMTEFTSPGVYYYISKNLAKSFGAIVVSSQPKVHKIQVQTASISPDPVIMSMNDVACWIFKGLRHHDVQELNTVDQLLDIQLNSPHLQHPRRTLCRLATEKGVHHYTSKSFLKSTKGEQRSDESRITSLLVDDASDSMVVRINSQGFHPKNVNITQGQSVLWTWKEAGEEAHNIIHVNPPDSDTPLSVIHGGQSFSSGRPVAKNSFLYTFDEPGTYCVASQGAPGFAGSVTILADTTKTAAPYILDEENLAGTVDKNFTIHLKCDTPGSTIYYTLDGSAPDLSRVIPKNHKGMWNAVHGKTELYNPDKGVVLKQSGLVVLRAISISKNALNSNVVTSKRFWVLRGDEDDASVSSGEPEPAPADNSASWQWWQCVPVIKGCFTSPGVMEVFWELPPTESTSLVKGYQVFLNGVSYCDVFPANHNSVNIAGLAGGRMYEINLEVYPTEAMFLPHKSNKLVMKCPKTTGTGGPLISLEQTDKRDTLAVLWMAISTDECPVDCYRVYLNRQMVGSPVVPDVNTDRCKVVIDGCNIGTTYHVVVAALPEDGSSPKMSNELEIKMPLDFSHIRLPPAELRAPDEDLYREYIEVSEGASYVESDAAPRPATEPVTFDLTDPAMQTRSESVIQDHFVEDPLYSETGNMMPEAGYYEGMEGYPKVMEGYREYPPHSAEGRGVGEHDQLAGEDMGEEEEEEGEHEDYGDYHQQSTTNLASNMHPVIQSRRSSQISHNLAAGSSGQYQMAAYGSQTMTQSQGPGMQQNTMASASQGSLRSLNPPPAGMVMQYPPPIPTGPAVIAGPPVFTPRPPTTQPTGRPPQYPQVQPQTHHQTPQKFPPQNAEITQHQKAMPAVSPAPPPQPPPPPQQPDAGPYLEGIRYQSHLYPAPDKAGEPAFGFIDATQGPWKNRMKSVAAATRAMKRLDFETAEKTGRQNGPGTGNLPTRGVEVEVDDEGDSSAEGGEAGTKVKKKKKKRTTAVVEVQGDAHLRYEPKKEITTASSAVPVLGQQEGHDQFLPAPIVTADGRGNDAVLISWCFERSAEPLYRLLVCVVNVVGKRFAPGIGSDISFECYQQVGDTGEPAIQHCWNVTSGSEVQIGGLLPGIHYTIFVVANYALVKAKTPTELQAKSEPIRYTTIGPPDAPVLRPYATGLYQVTLAWDAPHTHSEVEVIGYRVLVDDRQLGDLLGKSTYKTTIDNLQPGRTIIVNVIAVTNHQVGSSEPSNAIKVTCPRKPPPPLATQQPSYKRGSVIAGWEKPNPGESLPYGEDIIMYRIFVDKNWHGEVNASSAGNRSGYQYYLTGLSSGQAYDINVRTYAGQHKVDPQSDHIFCISESEESNTVPVMCPAPPRSPCLRVEGMHTEGIDITWEMPQQFGDAQISGYQLMKDGKLYGSIMPPDVHSLRIKDVNLGDRVELQILALTDHPVGRQESKSKGEDADGDSGVGTGTHATDDKDPMAGYQEVYIGDRYSACRPGPTLTLVYTGLVMAPTKVWCEKVTGHSAMIVWDYNKEPKAHYIKPENYQITWWAKEQDDGEINSQAMKDDHLLITGLKPNVVYNVVVEARKMQAYSAINEGDKEVDDGFGNMFILTGKSETITLRTARPPPAPTNLGITATTTHSIQVAWDPATEASIDLLGIRVDAVAMKTSTSNKHTAVEVMPDATTATLDNMEEKTEYLITVTFITDEYFEQLPDGSEIKSQRTLPKNTPPPEDPWLSNSSMIAMTSGSEAPTNIQIKENTINSVTLSWTPPVVFGSNRLQGTVVRWSDTNKGFGDDDNLAHHKSIVADCNEAMIEDLYPGVKYKVVVEAVVSVKTNITGDARDPESEKRNRRTAHVPSEPLFVRTRAPCEAPKPIITAYTTNTIQLYWEKPLLYAVVGKDGYDNNKYLKMSLEGYRLEINGRPHMRLIPTAQSCTLVKCRPGKNYQIVLVALTCTEDVKKERKKMAKELNGSAVLNNREWNESIDEGNNDESPSEPLEVSLPPTRDDLLSELTVNFAAPSGLASENYAGDVHVEWGIQGNNNTSKVRGFHVSWRCTADDSLQRKVLTSATRICSIPVGYPRNVYDVFLEPQFDGDVLASETQKCQVLVPGPPDPPEIWMRSVGREEFVIEWGEPRLYGVRVGGYQVYLNGKKAGNELNTTHRKAVIPCKPKRRYKVNLVAVSADPNYDDSGHSNTLIITAGSDISQTLEGAPLTTDDGVEETVDLPVKVVKVTEKSIQIDWAEYIEPEGVVFYRVTWSSVAQPAEREVKLPSGEKSCVLHKCFPGTNHFLRLYAMGREDKILDVSKQLTVQTCAPPDTPIVTVRACNFRYIAIQWDKPNTYGDTLVTGYKVYVNGVVEAVLGPDQFSYSFTQGHWCREYAFQVQATTAVDKLNSKPSEPLVVAWPGVQPPELKRAPAVSGNSVKVVWDKPPATDGVKIKMYKVICIDEETQQPVQVVSPIHPDTNEAELHNLKAGSYLVFAEIHVHGTNDVVKTESLKVRPTLTPDPPHISVTVIGLEERRQIEKITCDLINKRDRLINFLTNREVSQSLRLNDEDQVLVKVTEDLAHIEDKLDDCLASLSHYTGHLLSHVSWTCPQSNPDIRVSGYKVLVDGKQYGTTLHAGIQNVRIKLGLQAPSHHLSMVSVCDHPHTTSVQSNVVELLTEPFKPFSFFSFLDSGGPKTAGLYAPTLITERKHRRTINQGLLKRHIPPPSATLMDVFEGEYHPLFPPSGPRSATALLFWAKWNPASKKALGWFVRYASQATQYEFIAVACTEHDPTANDRQDLLHTITENGWRDKRVRHITSHCAKASTIGSEYIKNRNGEIDESTATDLTQLFGIGGVPMLAVVHPGDYIAWKGRYCAFDYISFENFMKYIFSQTTGQGAPTSDPWDTDIDIDALDGVSKRGMSESQLLIHRPTNNMRLGTGTTSTHRLNGNRPASGKKPLFRKTNQKKGKDILSVSNRPYSASSPYSQKLVSEDSMGAPPPRRRIKSGRKTDGNY